MQENSIAAGPPPGPRWGGELIALLQISNWVRAHCPSPRTPTSAFGLPGLLGLALRIRPLYVDHGSANVIANDL